MNAPAEEHAPPDKPRSLRVSVIAGLTLAGVAVASLFIGAPAFMALATVVVIVAQAELYAVLRRTGRSPATLVGLVGGAVLLVGTYLRGEIALPLLVAVPLPLLMAWSLTVPAAKAASTVTSTYFGLLYGPFLAAFAVLVLRRQHGVVLVAVFIAIVALQDSGAYLVGRKIGRRRMSPRISPKKTWEGLAGGTLLAVAGAVAASPFLPGLDPAMALALAAVVCVVAPFGDLAESAVKRDLGVKDMGSIMPGHGGFFDRIDAIIFAAPAAYLVLAPPWS